MRKAIILLGCLLVLGMSGCGDDSPAEGAEGGACYPNATCDVGFFCVSGICVAIPNNTGPRDVGVFDFPGQPGW